MPRKRKIFYGWWMVLAHATLNVFAGGTFVYGFTTFFNPIRNTFGWTAAVTSIAFVLQRLEWGIMGPVAGFLVDRVGTRKLMLPGWGLAALGFLWCLLRSGNGYELCPLSGSQYSYSQLVCQEEKPSHDFRICGYGT